jgi:hypothetical protein
MAYAVAVDAVSTSNVSTSSPTSAVFDGYTVSTGHRVLLAAQTTASQNGVWVFNGTGVAMSRPIAPDPYQNGINFDTATLVPVTNGNVYGGTVWGIDPAQVVTVGTTAHTLTRISLPPIQARCATTVNINLASTITTIDAVSVVGNGTQGSDLVLVKNQSTAAQNGVYWANTSGPMVRTTEPLPPLRRVAVSQGTVNAHCLFELVNQGAVVLGTTGIDFSSQKTAFNVRDFGAIGDGVTDDTASINAAGAAASAAGGGTVYFPNGTYLVSEYQSNFQTIMLQTGVSWLGQSREGVVIKLAAAQRAFVRGFSNQAGGAISDFSIENLTYDGNKAGQAYTTWTPSTAYTAGNLVINGGNIYLCTVSGTSAGSGGPTGTGPAIVDGTVTWKYISAPDLNHRDAIFLYNTQRVTVRNVELRNGTGSGIVCYQSGYDNMISNVYIHDNAWMGISWGDAGGNHRSSVRDFNITNNAGGLHIEASNPDGEIVMEHGYVDSSAGAYAVEIAGASLAVDYVANVWVRGVNVNGGVLVTNAANVHITECNITCSDATLPSSSAQVPVKISGDVQDVWVDHCTITLTAAATAAQAVWMAGNQTGLASDNLNVSDNAIYVYSTTAHGIVMQASGTARCERNKVVAIGAQPWRASTPYAPSLYYVNQPQGPTNAGLLSPSVAAIRVTNGNQVYQVVNMSGTSAASGGPTGTGTGIVDNTVVWNWVSAGSGGTAWAPNTVYTIGTQVTNGGNIYTVVAGVSAASGGPTGTGANIVDGGVIWQWVGSTAIGAPWAATTSYSSVYAPRVTNGGKTYVCVPGKSASSGGPTGTGTGIVDNTVVWNWVSAGSGGTAWAPNTVYTIGTQVTNGGNIYTVVAGVSAASGGPTGTGTNISDGTVAWDYVPYPACYGVFLNLLIARIMETALIRGNEFTDFNVGVATGAVASTVKCNYCDISANTFHAVTSGVMTSCIAWEVDTRPSILAPSAHENVCSDTTTTTIAPASNGQVLPLATIYVANTVGFPTSGTVLLFTSAGTQTVTYTGTTSTSFTGCTGGTATIVTGMPVSSTIPIQMFGTFPAAPLFIDGNRGACGVYNCAGSPNGQITEIVARWQFNVMVQQGLSCS